MRHDLDSALCGQHPKSSHLLSPYRWPLYPFLPSHITFECVIMLLWTWSVSRLAHLKCWFIYRLHLEIQTQKPWRASTPSPRLLQEAGGQTAFLTRGHCTRFPSEEESWGHKGHVLLRSHGPGMGTHPQGGNILASRPLDRVPFLNRYLFQFYIGWHRPEWNLCFISSINWN